MTSLKSVSILKNLCPSLRNLRITTPNSNSKYKTSMTITRKGIVHLIEKYLTCSPTSKVWSITKSNKSKIMYKQSSRKIKKSTSKSLMKNNPNLTNSNTPFKRLMKKSTKPMPALPKICRIAFETILLKTLPSEETFKNHNKLSNQPLNKSLKNYNSSNQISITVNKTFSISK